MKSFQRRKNNHLKFRLTKTKKPSKQRIPWARLFARVFNSDVETCPHCQGRVKIIAAIEDPAISIQYFRIERFPFASTLNLPRISEVLTHFGSKNIIPTNNELAAT